MQTTTLRRFPLTTLCIAVIFVLCFCTPPSTPLDGVPLIDKWTHVAMYAGLCCVFWLEWWLGGQNAASRRLIVAAAAAAALMGGAIELLQAYATTNRSGEWLDFLADCIGVAVGTTLGVVAIKPVARHMLRHILRK